MHPAVAEDIVLVGHNWQFLLGSLSAEAASNDTHSSQWPPTMASEIASPSARFSGGYGLSKSVVCVHLSICSNPFCPRVPAGRVVLIAINHKSIVIDLKRSHGAVEFFPVTVFLVHWVCQNICL